MQFAGLAAMAARLGPLLGRTTSRAATAARTGATLHSVREAALNRSFGDIMGGKKSLHQEEDRIREEEKEQRVKEKSRQALEKMTKAALGSVTALIGIPKAVQALGQAIAARNAELASFGGTISAATQRLEAERMGRQARLAAATGQSAADQMQSQSRLENALAPWKMAGRNIGNRLSEFGNNIMSNVAETFNNAPVVGELIKWLAGQEQKAENVPMIDFLADIAEGKWKPGEKKKNDGGVNRPL